jgi:hypothetical protein
VNSLPSPANPADSMLISYTAHKSVLLNAHKLAQKESFCRVVLGTCRIEYTRALINEIQESRSKPWDKEGERRTDTEIPDKKKYSK